MSATKVESIESATSLIEQFNEYDKIFKLVFLRYNGKTENLTIQYRLKTYKNSMVSGEFLENLIVQYLRNPIQIPSDQYYVEIYDQETTENLGQNPKYFGIMDDYWIFNISDLLNLGSEYIDIIITSKFKINANSLIAFHISNQPKVLQSYLVKYELTALLKSNLLPERFQFIDIDLTLNLVLNDFLAHFIPRRFLIAASKWRNMEVYEKGNLRKKRFYINLIRNKYGIKPIQFNDRIHSIFLEIHQYIYENFKSVLEIENKKGEFGVKPPKGIKFIDKPGFVFTKLKFKTNFDNNNLISNAILTIDLSWMKSIFDKYFSND